MKLILSNKFIKYFVISFIVFGIILMLSLLSRYFDDIFGKGFPAAPIIQFLFYTFLSLFGFTLFLGLLIATILTFKYYSLNIGFDFKRQIISGLWIVLGFSVLLMGYNNWVLPRANLEMTVMLYDFKQTAPDSTLSKTDKSLFMDNWATLSLHGINLKLDTLNSDIRDNIAKCDSLLRTLPTSSSLKIYNSLKLGEYGLKLNTTIQDSVPEDVINYTDYKIQSYVNNARQIQNRKQKFVKELIGRFILPVELMFIFVIGASFGFYYNDQKSFLLLILGLFTANFFYGNMLSFENLASKSTIDSILWSVIPIIVLIVITLIFLSKAIKKAKNTPSFI